jgi:DNA-3-methyladenine glycosylase I
MIEYHDNEWGVPVYDDRTMFEFLVLEGFQAGLRWDLILNRRAEMKKAFDNFDLVKVSEYTEADVERLLNNPKIIRNRLKISSTINNARMVREIQKEFGSFSEFLWTFVQGKPVRNELRSFSEMPSKTEESTLMGKALKRRGFKFVGPTICYSLMQAVGMVNDHLVHCFRYNEI